MTGSALAGIALLAIGGAGIAVGGWSAGTGRRPRWLSTKSIAEGTVRMWGTGTALAGLGVAIFGLDQIVPSGAFLGLPAIVLIFGGAGLVVLATPSRRRPRQGK